MGNITVKGKSGQAYAYNSNNDTETSLVGNDLSRLDGIESQDNFVDYSNFSDKLEYGYMSFSFEDGVLYTITEYKTTEAFTEEELHELGEETQGQWSDGIGEGFEQFACDYLEDGSEIFLSPWFYGQELTITQEI